MSCWFSVPGLAQVGLDHFQLDKGSALTGFGNTPITCERRNCAIIRFIMYIKTMHKLWPLDKRLMIRPIQHAVLLACTRPTLLSLY
jgi:hypothetical protein